MRFIYNSIQVASRPMRTQEGLFLVTHADRVEALHESTETFLPTDVILYTLLPSILFAVSIVSILYVLSFRLVGGLVQSDATFQKKRKVCYQMTNLAVNFVLSIMGVYYMYWRTPQGVEVEEKITGFTDFYWLACLQLAFQLWSIPIGILYVKESPMMLMHHVTVIIVGCMSAFMTAGFRCWVPFFFGVMELSSIPLAVMNTFKDNPDWIKKQPTLFLTIRLLFCFSFLYIRIWLMVPIKQTYLRDHYLLWSTSKNAIFRNYMATVWCASCFLMVLQFYWAILIVQGILKQVFKGAKSRDKKDK